MYTHDVSGTDVFAIQNTAYGFKAMEDITSGDHNTAMGYNSSANFTTGAQNVAIGAYSLGLAVTAAANVARLWGYVKR